ncbi:MAG: UDP-N-acetyl-D-mannosamine dehydrogenase [Candidatus Riflebacteria bacterium]|nr:UDP-N-acetyl-D-mannosamine dehydrogenase [Candidatus Riflebacteria bacterium]
MNNLPGTPKTACFMGLGYIGLPTAIIAAVAGIDVCGVDINPEIVEKTNSGSLHFFEPNLGEMCARVVAEGKLKAYSEPIPCDAYFIVVPTPFKANHEPDISYVKAATQRVIPLLKENDLFVIESTSPIGTTEKIVQGIYAERPELKGKIYAAYCPERVLPGNIVAELIRNDRIIGGINGDSAKVAAAFYKMFVKGELHITDSKTAEMCKLTENSSRDVQIAFANELSMICDKAGINVWELIKLANKHPRVNILQPGCGVGGHCIAVDPYFLTSDFPVESRIIATARDINNYKAFWCAERICNEILKFEIQNHRKPVTAIMGLAFKPNIDDLRESPAKYISTRVIQTVDSEILISEPNIKKHDVFKLTDYAEAYEKADIVAFLLAHNEYKTLEKRPDKIVLNFCGLANFVDTDIKECL